MKSAMMLSILSILTISLPLAVVSIAQPVRAELQAEAGDILSITSEGKLAVFVTNSWEVVIAKDVNGYTYSGKKNGRRGIKISGGRLIKSGGKHFYKWNNAGTIYQIVWQPTDPHFARLQAFDLRGKEIFNELMSASFD